ncbi:MAG: OmpH family outer membrane protein [Bdellovibrionales bacterium]|nr:OmpH family outer membrane protein [Bdellovibrionales bacterium]
MKNRGLRSLWLIASIVSLCCAQVGAGEENVESVGGSTQDVREVYVVDIQQVLSESIAGKASKTDLEAEIKQIERQIDVKKRELLEYQSKIAQQQTLLSKSALEEKGEEFRKREKEVARFIKDQQDEISRKRDKVIARLVGEVDGVISELALKSSYKIVLERDPRLVLYVNKDFDLTDEVIERLNQKKLSL